MCNGRQQGVAHALFARLFTRLLLGPRQRGALQSLAHLIAQGLKMGAQLRSRAARAQAGQQGGACRATAPAQRQVDVGLFLVRAAAMAQGPALARAQRKTGLLVGVDGTQWRGIGQPQRHRAVGNLAQQFLQPPQVHQRIGGIAQQITPGAQGRFAAGGLAGPRRGATLAQQQQAHQGIHAQQGQKQQGVTLQVHRPVAARRHEPPIEGRHAGTAGQQSGPARQPQRSHGRAQHQEQGHIAHVDPAVQPEQTHPAHGPGRDAQPPGHARPGSGAVRRIQGRCDRRFGDHGASP